MAESASKALLPQKDCPKCGDYLDFMIQHLKNEDFTYGVVCRGCKTGFMNYYNFVRWEEIK